MLARSPLYDVMNTSYVADPFGIAPWNVAAYTYDCVIAFAIAFSSSADFNDGVEVARRFRETRFTGATGQVEFDAAGDRDPATINCTVAEDRTRLVLCHGTHENGRTAHHMCVIRVAQTCCTTGCAAPPTL